MNCSKCGAKLAADALFCANCGAKVEQPKKFCPKCGAEMKEDALFCEVCGAKFGDTEGKTNIAHREEQPVGKETKPKVPISTILRNHAAKIVVGLVLLVSIATWACICMKSGYAETLYNKGALCYASNNHKEAKTFFEKSARMGNPDAMYRIGYMCWHGEGVAKNRQEAEMWYKKAEKAYLTRIKKKDYKAIGDLILNLYVLSEADFGNDDAIVLEPDNATLNELGKQYIAYLNDEISKENPDAMKMLADIYSSYCTGWEVGIFLQFTADADKLSNTANVDNNFEYTHSKATWLYQKAFVTYQKQAEAGDANAMMILGRMYANGQGVQENKSEALKWLNKAAEKGNIQAKITLMYINPGL